MFVDKHLHIDRDDQLSTSIGAAMRTAKNGTVRIDIADQLAAIIELDDGLIEVDLVRPEFFKIPQDETGMLDKLKTAAEFGRKLSENGVTLSFLRRGKEAVRLGKDAHPTLSKIITRSNDIQVKSTREFTKLKKDLQTD